MKIIQFFYGKIPEIYRFFMNRIQESKPDSVEYKLITELPKSIDVKRFADIRYASDLFRLMYLREHPFDIWLDSDVIVDRWLDFDRAYAFRESSESIFCPYGNTEVLDRMIEEFDYDRQCIAGLFRKYQNEFSVIPDGYFRHLGIGAMCRKTTGLWSQVGNSNVTIEKHNSVILVKHENQKFISLMPRIEVLKNVTLICTCKNRETFLQQSLLTWRAYGFDDIVIVDWSSEKSLSLSDVTVIRVEDQKVFDGAIARNLGARYAKRDYLFFVDADVKIIGNLDLFSKLNASSFHHGDFATDRHTYGTLLVAKDNFEKANGYNELMSGWGYEDDDLYRRLRELGLRETTFPYLSLEHINHSDNLRTQFRNQSGEDAESSRERNLKLSEERSWTKDSEQKKILTSAGMI